MLWHTPLRKLFGFGFSLVSWSSLCHGHFLFSVTTRWHVLFQILSLFPLGPNIDIRHHFICAHVQEGSFSTTWVPTKDMPADIYSVLRSGFFNFDISQQWLDVFFSSERGPPIIFHSLSTLKFCYYLNNGWLNSFHLREDPPAFC